MDFCEKKLRSGNLEIRLTECSALELVDVEREERLWIIPDAKLLLPQFAYDASLCGAEVSESFMKLSFQSDFLISGTVLLEVRSPGFLLGGEFIPKRDAELNRLNICAEGTKCGCYHIRIFRNRHYTEAVCPEVILGDAFSVKTDSTDWQFAPHPSAMLFTRNSSNLFFGAVCAPVGGYGLFAEGKENVFKAFYLNYGAAPDGMKIAAGTVWKTPGFRLFLRRGGDEFDAYGDFGRILVRERYIPDPAAKKRFGWHMEHVYCTWLDQCAMTGTMPPADLREQAMLEYEGVKPSWCPLTESLVRRAAETIRREGLPIRTILIDGGWSRNTCNFTAAPERFSDLRKLVDDLFTARIPSKADHDTVFSGR